MGRDHSVSVSGTAVSGTDVSGTDVSGTDGTGSHVWNRSAEKGTSTKISFQ